MSRHFSLFDITDVEDFCAAIARRYLARHNAHLSANELEDLVAHLVAKAWELSLKFDGRQTEGHARPIEFGGWAAKLLRHACVDWYRTRFVDQRYSYGDDARRDAIAFPLSLSGPANSEGGDELRLGNIVVDDAGNAHDAYERGAAFIRQVGTRLVDGYGTHEIANELRISTFSIKRLENCVGQSVGSAELLAAVLDDEL